MRIIYNNLIDGVDATDLYATSELIGYPVSNIQNQRLGKKWLTDPATSQSVTIDFNADMPTVDTVAVLGHNITTACTVSVMASDSDLFPIASYSTSITVVDEGMLLKFLSSAESGYRYWHFEFSGQGDLEIGRLWLGRYSSISPSSLIDFSVEKKRSDTVLYNKSRQKFAVPGVGWRKFNLSFPRTSSTTLTLIQSLYDDVGNHSSFIFCNFDTLRIGDDERYRLVEPVYCSIVGDLSFKHDKRLHFTYSLTLEEDR